MTQKANESNPDQPALTPFDRTCLERLLKAGHTATAAKLYRAICRCSVEEAEQQINEMARMHKAG